jgi:hypothetical protein
MAIPFQTIPRLHPMPGSEDPFHADDADPPGKTFLTPALPTPLKKSPAGSATKPLPSVPLQTIKASRYPYQQLTSWINPLFLLSPPKISSATSPTSYQKHFDCSQNRAQPWKQCSDTLICITLTFFNNSHPLETLNDLTHFSLIPKMGIDLVAQPLRGYTV